MIGRRPRVLARLLWNNTWRLSALFVLVFTGVSAVVYVVERDAPGGHVSSVGDAVWFSVVTLATVGYGDTYPVTVTGRAVAAGFILFTLTGIGFLLAAINEAVLEFKRMDESGLIGTDMRHHVVVYGFGPVAQTAVQELMLAGRRVALMCEHADEVAAARHLGPPTQLFVTHGSLSQSVLRERLNAESAHTAVIAASDDAGNIIATLNVRAVNARARVVVAVRAPELRQTLIASGVTYVASPYELSGRLVASASFEPEVAQFVEDVTSSALGDYDLQQFPVGSLAGQTVSQIRSEMEAIDGPLLVALAMKRGVDFAISPHPPRSQVVGPEDHVIVLASDAQAKRFRERYGVTQGR